ncbi:hypothetical protein D3C78_1945000 [compost metagenome]
MTISSSVRYGTYLSSSASVSSALENPVTSLPLISSEPSDSLMFSKPTAPWQTDETMPPLS